MRVCRSALALCLMAGLGAAHAADNKAGNTVATWTDADGTTHYGDAQFAPATATEVIVAPANAMEAPTSAPSSRRSGGPVWTVIDQPPKQNKVGWRSKSEGPKNGPISPSHR